MNRIVLTDSLKARLAAQPPPEAPVFPFPWEGLEEYAAEHLAGRLPLVGYGSLLNKASAANTLHACTQRTPCIAFGCRRVFNYRMPKAVLSRRGITQASTSIAALNVLATQNSHDVINGMLIAVELADIPALKLREFGYDLTPVYYLPWHDLDSISLSIAYVLCAPDIASRPEFQVTDSNLLPEPSYALLCEEGAAEVSQDFRDAFLATTYLADKDTLWKP